LPAANDLVGLILLSLAYMHGKPSTDTKYIAVREDLSGVSVYFWVTDNRQSNTPMPTVETFGSFHALRGCEYFLRCFTHRSRSLAYSVLASSATAQYTAKFTLSLRSRVTGTAIGSAARITTDRGAGTPAPGRACRGRYSYNLWLVPIERLNLLRTSVTQH
jgi:hypothetical protein